MEITLDKVNVLEKLKLIDDHWNPRIAGKINDHAVKLVKFKGPFDWHHHEKEDEFFMVVKGHFRMEFRDKSVTINEGEFIIVPRMVEHRPVADQEVEVLLIEPESTINTGTETTDRTVTHLETI